MRGGASANGVGSRVAWGVALPLSLSRTRVAWETFRCRVGPRLVNSPCKPPRGGDEHEQARFYPKTHV